MPKKKETNNTVYWLAGGAVLAFILLPKKANYKYFELSEFDSPDAPGSGAMYMDRSFVQRLDRARGRAGVPFVIISGYRTFGHNLDVGGVLDSAHLLGLGADIETTPATKGIIVEALLNEGFTRLGIGDNSVHVDADPYKPQKVAWRYTDDGPVSIPFPPVV